MARTARPSKTSDIGLGPFYHHDHAITIGENSENSSSKKREGCCQAEGMGKKQER
jgi:hypothetical protein